MSSLNKALFDAAYEWHCNQGNRIFVTMFAERVTEHSILRQYVHQIPGITNGETLTLNISPSACKMVSMEEGLFVDARYGGKLASDTFTWDKVVSMCNPDNPHQGIAFPQILITGEDSVPETNVAPMKKSNPFSVIDGGKE